MDNKLYCISGHQPAEFYKEGDYRMRYAGVNSKGRACVLTMGELRGFRQRAYFFSKAEAEEFLNNFVRKFEDRDFGWKVHEASKNNAARQIFDNGDAEFEKVMSDCGVAYRITNRI